MEGLSGRRVSKQTYPDSQNLFTFGPRRDLSGRIVGIGVMSPRRCLRDGPSRRRGGRRRQMLYQRPYRHRHGHERRDQTPGDEEVSGLGGKRPNSPRLRQCAAGVLLAQLGPGRDGGPAGEGIRDWRERLFAHDPLDLPDPVAGTPNLEKRDLERQRQCHQGHRDPGGRSRALQTVWQAGTPAEATLPGHDGPGRGAAPGPRGYFPKE